MAFIMTSYHTTLGKNASYCCAVLIALAAYVILASFAVSPCALAYGQEPEGSQAVHTQSEDAGFFAVLNADGSLVFQAQPSSDTGAINYSGRLSGYGNSGVVPWLASASDITSVSFDPSFRDLKPTSLKFWFADCTNLATVDLTNLDSSASTTMGSLFKGCSSLREIKGLNSFSTSSSTYFGGMFNGCTSLASLDLSSFDASKVTYFCQMFYGCSGLTELNLTGWRTPEARLMVEVFAGCSSLKSLDLRGFDTSNVSTMYHEFDGCSSLEYLDLSTINTSKMGTMTSMFDGCASLRCIVLGRDFSFCGSGSERKCSLPSGSWQSSVDGVLYDAAFVPNNVAATYAYTGSPSDEDPAPGASGTDCDAKDPAGDSPDNPGQNSTASSSSSTDGAESASSSSGQGQASSSSGGSSVSGGFTGSGSSNVKSASGAQKTPAKASAKAKGIATGKTAKVSGATYKVTSNAKKNPTVWLQKAPRSKTTVTIPATVTIKGKTYAVVGIAKNAFKNAKAKTVVIKTKKLAKSRVKNCFRGAKRLKTVSVPKSKRAAYKKIFKKANSGKSVTVR